MSVEPENTEEGLDPSSWVEDHGDLLFRFAVSRVRNRELAEELVHEALLAALQSRGRFEGRSRERTWLVQILRHKIADHYRRRDRELPASDLSEEAPATEALFTERGRWRSKPRRFSPDPAELAESGEFTEVLAGCLEQVPERQAAAFNLRVLDERSVEESCKELEVTATNLGVLLHRARLRLRRCLEERWFVRGRS